MRKGGALLSRVRRQIELAVNPGIQTNQLEEIAEKAIAEYAGKPSFKMVPGYHKATCININEGVVHGIPGNRIINEGDLVTIDVGMLYQGFHTDTANTIIAGRAQQNDKTFLQAGKLALKIAIEKAISGNRIEHISKAIQESIEKDGFTPARTLTGHGIGKNLHQDPQIPCISISEEKKSTIIKTGDTFAIEVIYTQGSPELILMDDGWTLCTRDGKKAAVFEETILVTDGQAEVLTKLEN